MTQQYVTDLAPSNPASGFMPSFYNALKRSAKGGKARSAARPEAHEAAPPIAARTIIISDLHLGKRAAAAAFLFEFLQNIACETLILNGDVIEGWGLKMRKRHPMPEMHVRCFDALNALAARGIKVIYIRGNHDEDMFRHNIKNRTITFKNKDGSIACPVDFRKSIEYSDAKGRKFLILHGDAFDGFLKSTKKKVIAHYADIAYEGLVALNGSVSRLVSHLGKTYASPIAALKRATKKLVGVIGDFERRISSPRIRLKYDGVICGHIHHAEIRDVHGCTYMNSGDWVESCTALVEDFSGEWKIVRWGKVREELGFTAPPTRHDPNPLAAYREVTQQQLKLVRQVWPGTDIADIMARIRDHTHNIRQLRIDLNPHWIPSGVANSNADEHDDENLRSSWRQRRQERKLANLRQRIRPCL